MDRLTCESNNAVNLIARTSPLTMAAGIPSQCSDVEVTRLFEDTILVSTCESNITTDSQSSSSESAITEFAFKAILLPDLERKRINQALFLPHSEMQQAITDVDSDLPTDGTFDSLRNEREKILRVIEKRATKTVEETYAILDTASSCYVIITIAIGVALLTTARLLLYTRLTGCIGSSGNI
ncbi:unnamed protein product [Anisakis simplex]|uniref:Miff domain-containing protein n=1 Tax=Anisakis simplex TaxID=6269 RepID=A0A0M3K607_ANISI|nr:unnamed protein product [Anisakis simplex]